MTTPRPTIQFLPGTVGPPGARVFYLEAVTADGVQRFKAEKLQVAALGERLGELPDIGDEPVGTEAAGLVDDPSALPVATQIGVGVLDEGVVVEVVTEAGSDVFLVPYSQAAAFAAEAARLVAGGRPRCPRCGLAMDPEGHVCPTGNGDLRHHRP